MVPHFMVHNPCGRTRAARRHWKQDPPPSGKPRQRLRWVGQAYVPCRLGSAVAAGRCKSTPRPQGTSLSLGAVIACKGTCASQAPLSRHGGATEVMPPACLLCSWISGVHSTGKYPAPSSKYPRKRMFAFFFQEKQKVDLTKPF